MDRVSAGLPVHGMFCLFLIFIPTAAMPLKGGHAQLRNQKVFRELIRLSKVKGTNPI